MKLFFRQAAIGLLVFGVINTSATVFYVDINCTNPAPPYTNWVTAATNIQDAVDVASVGDTVLVTNGLYQTGSSIAPDGYQSRVVVTNALILKGVNGSNYTVIDGGNTTRCVYLSAGSSLAGFAVTNGNAQRGFGGGIYGTSTNALVLNCLVISNAAHNGGGVFQATISNCTLAFNVCAVGGGADRCLLYGCMVAYNLSSSVGGGGGGVCASTLNNCLIVGNTSLTGGGGAIECAMNNCLIVSNTSGTEGGGALDCALNNCTVVGNSAYIGGGVTFPDGGEPWLPSRWINNCIIYYNSGTYGPDWYSATLSNCCTTSAAPGFNMIITNNPLFVNLSAGDFHLQSNSPCINAGNNAYVTGTNDLDGNPRIVGGTVDIGAYEYQTPASIISYAWLQQYGLPTDGSADYADTDGNGMNNWQKWIAGLDPTNPSSVLAMEPLVVSVSGIVVSWQSVSNLTYFLQCSTNLAAQPAFWTVRSNITAQAGTAAFTDRGATNSASYFYRVGVQQ